MDVFDYHIQLIPVRSRSENVMKLIGISARIIDAAIISGRYPVISSTKCLFVFESKANSSIEQRKFGSIIHRKTICIKGLILGRIACFTAKA